jgi:hypothetical protein
MKNLILFFLMFTFLSVIHGQEAEENTAEYPTKGDSEFGLMFGYASSYFTDGGYGPADGTKESGGVLIAVHYDHYFSKTWSIKGRLNFDPKGGADEFDDSKVKLNYITVPVMANWHFGKRKRWYLHFGPYAGFLMSADFEGNDVKELFDSTEFGFDFGIGVKIPIGSTMFFIESDGQSGFGDPTKLTTAGEENKLSRNALSLGIIF